MSDQNNSFACLSLNRTRNIRQTLLLCTRPPKPEQSPTTNQTDNRPITSSKASHGAIVAGSLPSRVLPRFPHRGGLPRRTHAAANFAEHIRRNHFTSHLLFGLLRHLSYNPSMESERLEVQRLFADEGGGGVLRLIGPLTTNNLADFQNAVRREQVPTIILDLSHVPYIDSAGLGSLVGAYVSGLKSGRRIILTGVNERVLNLLEITRMDKLFLIFPSLTDAIEALSNSGNA